VRANHACLGVDPALLAKREAFVFARVAKGLDRGQGWNLLPSAEARAPIPAAEVVPAIGDLNSILWAMGRKVGDRLTYTDERGRTVQVRIVGAVANSILQGNLLIDERAFLRLYPSEPGYRMFLVDAPFERADETSAVLTRGCARPGSSSLRRRTGSTPLTLCKTPTLGPSNSWAAWG
jgi:putative ABC transport system permease protein